MCFWRTVATQTYNKHRCARDAAPSDSDSADTELPEETSGKGERSAWDDESADHLPSAARDSLREEAEKGFITY